MAPDPKSTIFETLVKIVALRNEGMEIELISIKCVESIYVSSGFDLRITE